jgi:hypothetical protein
MEDCKNNYESEAVITEKFGTDDEEMQKCSTCSHLKYRHGMMTCDKIDNTTEN